MDVCLAHMHACQAHGFNNVKGALHDLKSPAGRRMKQKKEKKLIL